MIHASRHPYIKRHQWAFGSIALVLGASVAFIGLTALSAEQQIQASVAATTTLNQHYDAILPKLRAKHAADIAAATRTAEAAKLITETGATTPPVACTSLLQSHNNPQSIDILVNKAHCLSPLNYAPADLTSVDGFMLSAKAAPHLNDMLTAADTAGLRLSLTSAYRSYDDQVATYKDIAATKGSTDAADEMSARPGYSEHQTGLAVDFGITDCYLQCFAASPQYAWLQQHAAEYGFIQRYNPDEEKLTGYEAEPWHYRYVGKETALAIKAKGVKSLESYWGISGGNYLR